jgi:hypothetical protein
MPKILVVRRSRDCGQQIGHAPGEQQAEILRLRVIKQLKLIPLSAVRHLLDFSFKVCHCCNTL